MPYICTIWVRQEIVSLRDYFLCRGKKKFLRGMVSTTRNVVNWSCTWHNLIPPRWQNNVQYLNRNKKIFGFGSKDLVNYFSQKIPSDQLLHRVFQDRLGGTVRKKSRKLCNWVGRRGILFLFTVKWISLTPAFTEAVPLIYLFNQHLICLLFNVLWNDSSVVTQWM